MHSSQCYWRRTGISSFWKHAKPDIEVAAELCLEGFAVWGVLVAEPQGEELEGVKAL